VKAWGGRFSGAPDEVSSEFGRSIDVDAELALDDIAGSIAHVHGLERAGIVTAAEAERLIAGLTALRDEVTAGTLAWDPALEDVHMNLEFALEARIGPVAGKLHTGRSRNDQVANDLRLYLRGAIDRIAGQLAHVQRALVDLAERHADTLMPGFTHLQVAQPIVFGHHLLAYVEMFERDRERLLDARKRVNRLALGAAALAGTTFPIDRAFVAARLGFEGVCENSLDAVSDRDFAIEFCAVAALLMTHNHGSYNVRFRIHVTIQ